MAAADTFVRHWQIIATSYTCLDRLWSSKRWNSESGTLGHGAKMKHGMGAKHKDVDGHGASVKKKRIYLHLMSSMCKRNRHKNKQRGVLTLIVTLIHTQCTGRLYHIVYSYLSDEKVCIFSLKCYIDECK